MSLVAAQLKSQRPQPDRLQCLEAVRQIKPRLSDYWIFLALRSSLKIPLSNCASTMQMKSCNNSSISTCLHSSRRNTNRKVLSGNRLHSRIISTRLIWLRRRGHRRYLSYLTSSLCCRLVALIRICSRQFIRNWLTWRAWISQRN